MGEETKVTVSRAVVPSPPPLITSTHTHIHIGTLVSPVLLKGEELLASLPNMGSTFIYYCLHYISSSNHSFIAVWLAIYQHSCGWNTVLRLVPHWATDYCKQSASLFVKPGVWPVRFMRTYNFTFPLPGWQLHNLQIARSSRCVFCPPEWRYRHLPACLWLQGTVPPWL